MCDNIIKHANESLYKKLVAVAANKSFFKTKLVSYENWSFKVKSTWLKSHWNLIS